jgi:hypothetical protein
MQKALNGRNMQDLSQEERQALFAKVRESVTGAAKKDDKKGEASKGGAAATPAAGAPAPAGGPQVMTFTMGGPGGAGGRSGSGGMPPIMGGGGNFSAKEMEDAKLPAPPGEDSNLEVLLRPGLLADVEIIVEKVPNAIYLPNQAIFDKDGKPTVFVRVGDKFEPRAIQIAKRSETVSVISGGVKVGDTVSMSDPTAKPGQKKAEKKEGGSGAAGAMPSGGAGSGGGR